MTKRKRRTIMQWHAPRKAKRESMHTTSHGNGRINIVIFSCSLSWDFSLKNRPCRSANLILECLSVFIHTWQNPCPGMCLYFSLLLYADSLMISHFTTVRGLPSWSGQCQALVTLSRFACPVYCPPLLSTGSRCAISFWFTWVYHLQA